MKKVLIVGLGNIGSEYRHTRHNIGFEILDALAEKYQCDWEEKRYGALSSFRLKGYTVTLLKPSTYMNRSGSAVRYWMDHLKLSKEQILVLTDDLNLPIGKLRLRKKGSSGGHNGLEDIGQKLGHTQFSRLRFGIGADFSRGQQINFVLGKWEIEESSLIRDELLPLCIAMCEGFVLEGPDRTMSKFNN